MTHELVEQRPMLFPDGGVFLAVASITLDRSAASWRVPIELHARLRPLVREIREENCLDATTITRFADRLNEALGLRIATVSPADVRMSEVVAIMTGAMNADQVTKRDREQ